MDIDGFTAWFERRDRADLERIVALLQVDGETADGNVARRLGMNEVASGLRRSGRCRMACRAAHRVQEAAMAACERTGLAASSRADAVRLVRAAGDAARALAIVEDLGARGRALLGPFVHGATIDPSPSGPLWWADDGRVSAA